MAIPANYFTPDPERGQSQADIDVADVRRLAVEFERMVADVQNPRTRSGEALTAGQLTAIRTVRYPAWRTRAQQWFGRLPTP